MALSSKQKQSRSTVDTHIYARSTIHLQNLPNLNGSMKPQQRKRIKPRSSVLKSENVENSFFLSPKPDLKNLKSETRLI